MDRAYSVLTIKSVNEDERIIRGMATTPEVDRVGDIVEPLGVKFTNPMPLLHQHNHDEPVGTVSFEKPTKNGVAFEARLPKIDEPGSLKDRIDTAWGEVKAGLVRAVSIGFRPIEYAFIDGGGIRFIETEVYELSLVSVPANAGAKISTIKQFDVGAPAATGRPTPPADTPPAPRDKALKINLRPKGDTTMKTLAEQITALEAKRAANVAGMEAAMQKSMDEGRSTDAAEQEEFDTLAAELESIDNDLKRLKTMERIKAASAKPVDTALIRTPGDGAAARGGVEFKLQPKSAPGIRFARLAKVRAVARLDNEPMTAVAERMYGADSETAAVVKAAVVAGSTTSGNWAAALVSDEGGAFADFAAFLRPATILGKFGQGAIPDLRHVPFRQRLISQTGGGDGYWVGEGKPKPLTAFNFAGTSLEPLKVANIAVLTEENIRDSSPSSEAIVRDALRDALVATQDVAFIDPTNAGSAHVKPASITNGAEVIHATGTGDADDIRLDVRAVFQKFIDADNPPEAGVWIMSTTNALALSLMVNPLGQREFPNITMTGGTFEGLPVIASRYAGSYVTLVNASDIYEADNGEIVVDMSREASLEMKDSALTQNPLDGTGVAMVSLWQNNLVGLRAEKTINWSRRRASAVAYLSNVAWGGAVPVS